MSEPEVGDTEWLSLAGVNARVLGLRLRGAREARGFTQEQAAKVIEVARTTLVAIEKGERRIQPHELVRLAGLYGRRMGELLRPGEPAPPLAVQFRAPGIADAGDLEGMGRVLEEFQRLCEDYLELERIVELPLRRRYPEVREIGAGADVDQVAEDLAVSERARLGLGDGPVGNLRDVLEREVGMRVFLIAMPGRVSGLFGYDDALGGCIAVNLSHPQERRRHSLAHEYCHFLTNRYRSEMTVSGRYQRLPISERLAIAFASSFMLPANGLRRRFLEIQQTHGDFRVAEVFLLANYYGVSVESLVRRLEGLRLLRDGTWELLQVKGLRVRDAQKELGLPEPTGGDDALPSRYVALAVEAARDGRVSEGQFAQFLRTDRRSARRILVAHSDLQWGGESALLSSERISDGEGEGEQGGGDS